MNNSSQQVTHGIIRHWNNEKDYGFIGSMNLGDEGLFVHKNAMRDKDNQPEVGQLVSYNLSKDKTGRAFAANIRKPGDRVVSTKRSRTSKSPLLLMALLFIGVAANAVVLE